MSDKEYIWNFLMANIKNEYGVAGLMGNLYAESGLRFNRLQIEYSTSLGLTDEEYTERVDNGTYTKTQFVHDQAGYGLAQWTYYTRKQSLYELWKTGGYSSISDRDLQLTYLLVELKNSYPDVYDTLVNADSIRQASDKVLHDFENPKVQTESVEEKREKYGLDIYEEFTGTPIEPDSTSTKKRKGFNFVLFNRKRDIYG